MNPSKDKKWICNSSSRLIPSFILITLLFASAISSLNLHNPVDAKKKFTITTPLNYNNFSLPLNNYNKPNQTTENHVSAQKVASSTKLSMGANNNNNSLSHAYLTYQDTADGISMIYPSSWQKIEYPPGTAASGFNHRVVVSFLSPVNTADQWRPYVAVEIFSPPVKNETISQNNTISAANLGTHHAYESVNTNNEQFYLNKVAASNLRSINFKTLNTWTSIGNSTLLFTYQAEASKYPLYLPVVHKILDSFVTLGHSPVNK